jgi:hypothetical protein
MSTEPSELTRDQLEKAAHKIVNKLKQIEKLKKQRDDAGEATMAPEQLEKIARETDLLEKLQDLRSRIESTA